jgi:NAD(P)-dependent dehydrogenase (short-subunit alcohol dehydrogenase family)
MAEGLGSKLSAGRFGKPQAVAALALYLASDESAFVIRSEFTLDGGLTMMA